MGDQIANKKQVVNARHLIELLLEIMNPRKKEEDDEYRRRKSIHSIYQNTPEREFLYHLISKLGTCFATPEDEVISQYSKGEAMYFLSKGDCVVNI